MIVDHTEIAALRALVPRTRRLAGAGRARGGSRESRVSRGGLRLYVFSGCPAASTQSLHNHKLSIFGLRCTSYNSSCVPSSSKSITASSASAEASRMASRLSRVGRTTPAVLLASPCDAAPRSCVLVDRHGRCCAQKASTLAALAAPGSTCTRHAALPALVDRDR